MKSYPRLTAMLRRSGHSAVKTAEIILDASRGDRYALWWVRLLRNARP